VSAIALNPHEPAARAKRPVLVIANAPLEPDMLEQALAFRGLAPADVTVSLVTPARRHVQQRLARSLQTLRELRIGTEAWIGPPDPLAAAADAFDWLPAGELVVVSEPLERQSRHCRDTAFRLATHFSLPVLEVIADAEGPILVSLEVSGAPTQPEGAPAYPIAA
jgi:hypothetical protein